MSKMRMSILAAVVAFGAGLGSASSVLALPVQGNLSDTLVPTPAIQKVYYRHYGYRRYGYRYGYRRYGYRYGYRPYAYGYRHYGYRRYGYPYGYPYGYRHYY
jgi:hypothetical protein